MNNTRYIVAGYVENSRNHLNRIIDELYRHPETSFNEERSSDLICSILEDEGFKIERDVAKIKYSFTAGFGSSSPRIAYICEYNAVENMGHGCGHNVTAAINTVAAIGLKRAIGEIGGSVLVIGCPAEERYPSKISMLNQGIFRDIDAVICGHAMDKTCESGSSLGMLVLRITFKGVEAHASISFNEGKNALSPCVMLFNTIEVIKSRYADNTFINGIIDNGGKDINMIPGESGCMFMVKSTDKKTMDEASEEIINCAKFASGLYGCDMEYTYPEPEYLPLKTHHKLSKIACHNLKERGITDIHGPMVTPASLDIGNISQRIPVIHPYIGICEEPTRYYSREFAECTTSEYARERALKAACALALTGVDIIQDGEILKEDI